MATRNKHSRLNVPCVVEFVRRFCAARLNSPDKSEFSLRHLANEIEDRFQIKAHKTTIYRFIGKLGLGFAWRKSK